jgi:hypothetical protein
MLILCPLSPLVLSANLASPSPHHTPTHTPQIQTGSKEGKEERAERRGHHGGGGGGMHSGRGRRGGGDREDRDHAMWISPAMLGGLAGGSGAGPSGLA